MYSVTMQMLCASLVRVLDQFHHAKPDGGASNSLTKVSNVLPCTVRLMTVQMTSIKHITHRTSGMLLCSSNSNNPDCSKTRGFKTLPNKYCTEGWGGINATGAS